MTLPRASRRWPPTAATGASRSRASTLRSILYFLIFPNTLVSLHPDYVMLHTLWPKVAGPHRGRVRVVLRAGGDRRPGFDPSDAVEFWDQVNREDWDVCALTQQGMGSRRFTPGRYTTQEGDVHAFDVMVAERYLERCADPPR